jgi:hypothetical protein
MAKPVSARKRIAELYPEALFMDGYDDCIVGVSHRFGQEPIVAYNMHKVIKKLMGEGMTQDEAEEFYEFNQIGAWMGDRTPCFVILTEAL